MNLQPNMPLGNIFSTYISNYLTEQNKIIEELSEEDKRFYYDYNNFLLSQSLDNLNPIPFSKDIPEIPENIQEKIKKYIIDNNTEEELKPLINKFINYTESANLFNLLTNIKTLKIKHQKNKDHSLFYKTLGDYSVENNTIYLYSKKEATLSHEFIHASSSKKINDVWISGFSVSNKYGMFFNGLNEGFTELYNLRIFNPTSAAYKSNVVICECLETMFDDPKDVERAYFNNDIDLIYQTFLNYGTKEEFIYICKNLDYFAGTTYEISEYQEVLEVVSTIISRKNEQEKIQKLEKIIEEKGDLVIAGPVRAIKAIKKVTNISKKLVKKLENPIFD